MPDSIRPAPASRSTVACAVKSMLASTAHRARTQTKLGKLDALMREACQMRARREITEAELGDVATRYAGMRIAIAAGDVV